MTEKEINEIHDKLEEVWGDWIEVFDIIITNDLCIDDNNICNKYGDVIFGDIVLEIYPEEVSNLIHDYFHLYKSTKKPKVSEVPQPKSKYMKLC